MCSRTLAQKHSLQPWSLSKDVGMPSCWSMGEMTCSLLPSQVVKLHRKESWGKTDSGFRVMISLWKQEPGAGARSRTGKQRKPRGNREVTVNVPAFILGEESKGA